MCIQFEINSIINKQKYNRNENKRCLRHMSFDDG